MDKEVILDVIPIYKDEMYPTQKCWWHFRNESEAPREIKLQYMIIEIERKFFDCDCIIILEHGKVLEILKGGNTDEQKNR